MPSSFAESHERVGAHPHLRDGPPGICVPGRVAEGLDGVDREEERPGVTSRLEHVREVATGRERDGVAGHAEPPGARCHLRVRLLTRHQHARLPGHREMGEHVEQQRGLADAGLASEERHGRRHDAAAEHAIDAGGAGGNPPLVVGSGGQRAERVGTEGASCRPAGGPNLVDGPPLPAAGTTTYPLRHLLATRGAREDRPDLRHVRTVPNGSDIACHGRLPRLSSLGRCTLHPCNTKARKEG